MTAAALTHDLTQEFSVSNRLLGDVEKKERYRVYLMAMFVFSLPYDILYSTIIFMLLSVATLLDISKDKLKAIPKHAWIFMGLYFPTLIGYTYSYYKSEAGFMIERQLTMFLMPLILPMAVKIDARLVRIMLRALTTTAICAIIFLTFHALYSVKYLLHLPMKSVFSGVFFNHGYTKPIGIHAGYLSLYVSLSILYMVNTLLNLVKISERIACGMALLVLLLGLFFLASRNSIIATFFILIFIYPLFTLRNKRRYLLIAISCLAAAFLLINKIDYLKERFSKELISDLTSVSTNYTQYTVEPRLERWKKAVTLVERSPLIGYGTGDELAMLRYEYLKGGLVISYLENFNAHNEYLSFMIKYGIPGLLILLAAFAFYLFVAIRAREYIYFSFLVILMIGFYTENILDANKGIVFFAFFNTVLGYAALKSMKERKTTKNVAQT